MKKKMKNKKEEEKEANGLSSLPGGGQVDGLPPAASLVNASEIVQNNPENKKT